MKCTLTVGISGSGKTTWANDKEQSRSVNINRDDVRFALTGAKGWKEYKFNKTIENRVTEINKEKIVVAVSSGLDVIISDTNLNPRTRKELTTFCESLGYEVSIKEFPITLEEAWNRDRFRGNFAVGRDVLQKQWESWIQYLYDAGKYRRYSPNPSLPDAVIFDVDGTLAHVTNRGHFEWSKVGTDSVDIIVRQMYWDFQKRGYKMIVMSGRDSVCRSETHSWLYDNSIVFDDLLMRSEGDMRKDGIIKTELFWEFVAPYYNVVACVDDRPAMVCAWYDLGIPKVISVGNPWVEF
jgi:predicted kinase